MGFFLGIFPCDFIWNSWDEALEMLLEIIVLRLQETPRSVGPIPDRGCFFVVFFFFFFFFFPGERDGGGTPAGNHQMLVGMQPKHETWIEIW